MNMCTSTSGLPSPGAPPRALRAGGPVKGEVLWGDGFSRFELEDTAGGVPGTDRGVLPGVGPYGGVPGGVGLRPASGCSCTIPLLSSISGGRHMGPA
jgi:hypothetical protein